MGEEKPLYEFVTKEEINALAGPEKRPGIRIQELWKLANKALAERDAALEVASWCMGAPWANKTPKQAAEDHVRRLLQSGPKDEADTNEVSREKGRGA